jgi:integrase
MKHITYENLRNVYLLDYKTNKRKSLHTNRDGSVYLDAVRRLDSFFTSYAAKEIDADRIRHFIADQQKQGKSNGTINRSTSALRRMFRLALKDEKLRNVPFFPMLRESAPRSGFFERDEYERLFTALPDYLRPVLAIGYHTGMRRSEVTGLKWDQIDFLSNVLQLRAGETKNDHARTIPIVSQLRELLVQQYQRRHADCAFVWTVRVMLLKLEDSARCGSRAVSGSGSATWSWTSTQ